MFIADLPVNQTIDVVPPPACVDIAECESPLDQTLAGMGLRVVVSHAGDDVYAAVTLRGVFLQGVGTTIEDAKSRLVELLSEYNEIRRQG